MKRINFVENNLIRVLVAELNADLTNSKLLNIKSLASDGVVFTLTTKSGIKHLVCSLNASFPALYVSTDLPAVDETQKNNPYERQLKNSHLMALRQINDDRIVEMEWEIVNPVMGNKTLYLVVEFLGTFSNLILMDAERKITGFARGQGLDDGQDRTIASGAIYEFPPAKDLPGFYDLDRATFDQMVTEESEQPVWKFLVHRTNHLSPQVAMEIVRRADLAVNTRRSDIDLAMQEKLWNALLEIRQWCRETVIPTFYLYRNPDSSKPVGISLFPSQLYPEATVETASRLNELTAIGHDDIISQFEFERTKSRALKDLNKRIKKLTSLRKSLQNDLEKAEKADMYRLWGELIKANLRNLDRGKSEVTVTNFYDPKNATITIPLDPELDLHRNADIYFKRARKAEASETVIQKRMRKNNSELLKQHRLKEQIEAAQNMKQLTKLTTDPDGSTGQAKSGDIRSEKSNRPRFREFTVTDGWRVLVGRNDKQNDQLTHRTAALDDLWFHARNVKGSHVVLRREGRKSDVIPRALHEAAAIAAWYSKDKHSSKVAVDYTEVRFLRKPRGAPPGLVTFSQHKTLFVKPGLPSSEKE